MLPKKNKLKRDRDFKRIFEQGKYYEQDFIKLRVLKNDLKISRFGFIVGLKISKKATARNKIRRHLEEVVRLNLNKIKLGFDIIILANPAIIEKDYQTTEKTLIILFKKTGVIHKSSLD